MFCMPPGWNSLYLENHDQPRAVSRFGNPDPKYRVTSAKMLATWLLTLRGTPFLYQGQELGFPHPQKWKIEDYPDLETQVYYKRCVIAIYNRVYAWSLTLSSEYDRRKAVNLQQEPDMSDVMHAIRLKGRDNARFPMQWDRSPNAGFTASNVKPWIKMNDENSDINVYQQDEDPHSVLNYFRRLLHMRKQHPLMVSTIMFKLGIYDLTANIVLRYICPHKSYTS